MNLKQEAKSEKEKLKYMSWKDRIWYVWEYYKFHMLLVLIAFVILWVIGTSLYRQSFTTRLSMAIINDRSGGASSTAPLMEGLRNALNCQKKDIIEINEGLYLDTNEETMSQYSYASMAKIAALVSGGMLDIMITDEATIRHYENMDAYMDLRELLPEDLCIRRRWLYGSRSCLSGDLLTAQRHRNRHESSLSGSDKQHSPYRRCPFCH